MRLWYVVLALLLANAWLQLRREVARHHGADPAWEPCWAKRLLAALAQVLWTQSEPAFAQPLSQP